MHNITLTVFTPTYNRAHMLTSLYESLKNQTDKDFLWLIVDDGSSDSTCDLVKTFIDENEILIKYVKQENRGKYIAHNNGVKMCDTELFVCVDSDDTLLPEAVERTKKVWSKIKDDEKICGIVSPRKYPDEKMFDNPPVKAPLMHLYNKCGFHGETMLVFRSEILKKFLFPEIENEKFMSECVIYNQIDREYVLFYDNTFMCAGEYQEGGLTKTANTLYLKNPTSVLLMYKNIASFQTDFIKASKAYGSYLALKEKTGLPDPMKEYKVCLIVKLAGTILKKHYLKLF